MPYPYPVGSTVIGPAVHPKDKRPGTAIRLRSGAEVLMTGHCLRWLPWNWRKLQPPDSGLVLARIVTVTQGYQGL